MPFSSPATRRKRSTTCPKPSAYSAGRRAHTSSLRGRDRRFALPRLAPLAVPAAGAGPRLARSARATAVGNGSPRVERAAVVCARIDHNPDDNDYVFEAIKQYPDRFYQIADVDCEW